MDPLILTLKLDETDSRYFNSLRKQHFPRERNFLDAHLTLFHQLPDLPVIHEVLEELSAQQTRFPLSVVDLVSIGRGVAFKLESEALQGLHRQLQEYWTDYLIPQDRQKLWPHITIQNKVAPELAKNLQLQLRKEFQSFEIRAKGFQLWKYLSGPWEFYKNFEFVGETSG